MRAVVIILVLAACLLGSSYAVTCSADPTAVGCIDCNLSTMADNVECVEQPAASTTVDCSTDPSNSLCVVTSTTLKPPTTNCSPWTFPWDKVKKILLIFK